MGLSNWNKYLLQTPNCDFGIISKAQRSKPDMPSISTHLLHAIDDRNEYDVHLKGKSSLGYWNQLLYKYFVKYFLIFKLLPKVSKFQTTISGITLQH